MSLSCTNTPYPACFSKSLLYDLYKKSFFIERKFRLKKSRRISLELFFGNDFLWKESKDSIHLVANIITKTCLTKLNFEISAFFIKKCVEIVKQYVETLMRKAISFESLPINHSILLLTKIDNKLKRFLNHVNFRKLDYFFNMFMTKHSIISQC